MKKTYGIFMLLAFISGLSAINPGFLLAQSPPLWGTLKQGPYSTGYKTTWVYDYSRTWDTSARPIRMNIWYPAKHSNARKMLFERYVLTEPEDKRFSLYAEKLKQRDVGDQNKSLKGLFKGSGTLYDALLKTPANAVEDAAPEDGKFPVVVYSVGQNDYSQENTVLAEYLASNGYMVIAIPQIGISPRKTELMIDDELSFEAQVRDLEFAISQIHTFKNADADNIAAMGMSMGGVYSLLLAMRNSSVRLLIGLDPSFVASYESYGYKYWTAKYYDEWNLKIPIVTLYRDDEGANFDLINKLKFSKRHLIRFSGLIHADFTSYPMFTQSAPINQVDEYAIKHRDQGTAVKAYMEICNTVLKSLNRYIKNDQTVIISNSEKDDFKNGIDAPNEEEFCKLIDKNGLEETIRLFKEVSAKYPADTIIREKKIRRIAFEYYLNQDYKHAIGAYTLFTTAYPNSPGAFQSLGEMYMRDGNKKEALRNIKISLALNPNDEDTKKLYDKLNKSL